jgi:hypothetical protein
MRPSPLLLAIALCCGPGCTDEPSSVKQRRYSEEGKMREWLSRGRVEGPPAYDPHGRHQKPSPAVPPPHGR